MKTTQEMIEVMSAYVHGSEIQMDNGCGWGGTVVPAWNWLDNDYRIKPKQKVKLWLWAYRHNTRENWKMTTYFYPEYAARRTYPYAIKIESSMIEVDE